MTVKNHDRGAYADPIDREKTTTEDRCPRWAWCEREVPEDREHFLVTHGRRTGEPDDRFTPVARVGRPVERVFPVQWLLPGATSDERETIERARNQFDFYLVEHPTNPAFQDQDPWDYLLYHVGSSANVYSLIHWVYSADFKERGQM